MKYRLLLIVIGVCGVMAIGLHPTSRAQTTPEPPVPKAVADVEQRYQLQVAKVQRDFDAQVKKLRQERAEQLRTMLDKAMERKDADQVVVLRNLMQSLPDDATSANAGSSRNGSRAKVESATALQRYLADSKWEWGNDDALLLSGNGIVQNAGWQSRGLITRWEAIDRRTVVMKIEQGRDDNRLAIMRFNESLTSYDAINFEAGAKPNNYRRK